MKTIVLFFGRANPPHLGHGVAFKKVLDVAKSYQSNHIIYISRSTDKKKNPLSVMRKIFWLKKMFGSRYNFVAANDQIRTFIEAVKAQDGKFEQIVVIAGSDRVAEYQNLLNRYNGTKEFSFDSIKVVSAGERDPDAEGTGGLSATKVRQAAIDGDIETIVSGTGLSKNDAETLAREVRLGLGIVESKLRFDQLLDKLTPSMVGN